MEFLKRKLPTGIDDFERLRKNDFYYIDKTGLIKDLLDNWGEVNLFTRPRRFGKSLNMSMLQSFFSIDSDSSVFEGLKIMNEEALCEKYMGQYPVISISLKGINGQSYETAFKMAIRVINEAALNMEYTLPDVSQSVIITRMAGRTPVPERESIASFAAHQATMVVFLSTGMLKELSAELIRGGYPADTPAAIVYKATWPEEKVLRCTVETLEETAREEGVTKTALIVVGRILEGEYERSKLYDPAFTTEFRQASAVPDGDQRKEGQQ